MKAPMEARHIGVDGGSGHDPAQAELAIVVMMLQFHGSAPAALPPQERLGLTMPMVL